MAHPAGRATTAYANIINNLAQLQGAAAANHSAASLAITNAVANHIVPIQQAIGADDMVTAKALLETLNKALEPLENDLNIQGGGVAAVAVWASGLIDELRKLQAAMARQNF